MHRADVEQMRGARGAVDLNHAIFCFPRLGVLADLPAVERLAVE